MYQYGQANAGANTTLPDQTLPDQTITRGQTSMTFPGYSITELVIPRSSCDQGAPAGSNSGDAA